MVPGAGGTGVAAWGAKVAVVRAHEVTIDANAVAGFTGFFPTCAV